jgi:hypothetical protein
MNMRCLLVALAFGAASGCAPTSHVIVGNTHAPISPADVRVYLRPPQHFDEVAVLDASSQFSWATTDQQKTDKVIERLKEEAAKLGANGILLQGLGDKQVAAVTNTYGQSSTNLDATSYGNRTYGTATTTGSATSTSVGVWAKNGSAVAIFVPGE